MSLKTSTELDFTLARVLQTRLRETFERVTTELAPNATLGRLQERASKWAEELGWDIGKALRSDRRILEPQLAALHARLTSEAPVTEPAAKPVVAAAKPAAAKPVIAAAQPKLRPVVDDEPPTTYDMNFQLTPSQAAAVKLGSLDEHTAKRVIAIISEQLNTPREDIDLHHGFIADLKADSLDLVELVMEWEDEFNVQIPEYDQDKIATPGDVIRYVQERK
jgi:acyl carrier protein